jgi:tetratricopeptide (TPR) repeat protein
MIAQAPNTGILVPMKGVIAEHWMYLPSIGLFLGLAQTLDTVNLHRFFVVFVLSVALALGVKTHFQNRVWQDPVAFYENIFASGSHSGRAHTNVTPFYAHKGEFDKAVEHMQAAIRHPAPLTRAMVPELHIDLALMYLHVRPEDTDSGRVTAEEIKRALAVSGRIPEAIKELNKALELDPRLSGARDLLDVIYAYQQQREKTRLYEGWAAGQPGSR